MQPDKKLQRLAESRDLFVPDLSLPEGALVRTACWEAQPKNHSLGRTWGRVVLASHGSNERPVDGRGCG